MNIDVGEYRNSLIKSGLNQEQASAIAEGIERFAKSDLVTTKYELKSGLKELESSLIKWMISGFIGITLLILTVMFTVIQINTNSINLRIDDVNQRIDDVNQRIDDVNQQIIENRALIQKVLDNQHKQNE